MTGELLFFTSVRFQEMKDRVNKRAKERQKNQQKTHETSV